jgi:VRR-NUC domain
MSLELRIKLTPEMIGRGLTESSQQRALFAWRALHVGQLPDLKWLHAIPNGGERNDKVAANMKAEGVRSGVVDCFLPVARGGFFGLYIEMKRPGRDARTNGGLSDKQKEFIGDMKDTGYHVVVCYSWQEAVDRICSYLQLSRTRGLVSKDEFPGSYLDGAQPGSGA